MARPKGTNVVKDIVEAKVEKNTNDSKYKVLLRLNGKLEQPIRDAAEELGLPVTKFIEMAIREKLKNMN